MVMGELLRQRKHGGCRPGKAPNIDQEEREAAHDRLVRDYFGVKMAHHDTQMESSGRRKY